MTKFLICGRRDTSSFLKEFLVDYGTSKQLAPTYTVYSAAVVKTDQRWSISRRGLILPVYKAITLV